MTQRLVLAAVLCGVIACGRGGDETPPPVKVIDPSSAGLGPKPAPESVAAMLARASGQPAPASGNQASELINRAAQNLSDEQLEKKTREEHAQVVPLLPARSEQVDHVRIGWYVNQSVDALREAIETRKALVLFVGTNSCHWCAKQITNVLRCPSIERFAGDAVFAYGFLGEDKGTDAIAAALTMGGFPIMTVLEPDDEMILERGRVNGMFWAQDTGQHLENLVYKQAPRTRPGQLAPAPLPSRPATAINAKLGATNAKLTHRAPQPNCSK